MASLLLGQPLLWVLFVCQAALGVLGEVELHWEKTAVLKCLLGTIC